MTDLEAVARWSGITEGELLAVNSGRSSRKLSREAINSFKLIARSLEPWPRMAPIQVQPMPAEPEAIKPKRVNNPKPIRKPLPHQQFQISPPVTQRPEPSDDTTPEGRAAQRALEARHALEDRRIARELGID